MASLIKDKNRKFAVKSLRRDNFDTNGTKKHLELHKDSESVPGSEDQAIDRGDMQNLLGSEISILLTLDHPNITKVYRCIYDNQYINLIMELVRGESLADYLLGRPVLPGETESRIPEQECQTIIRQTMWAVKYFHA